MKKLLSNKKRLIYWLIVIVFIIIGFLVGSRTERKEIGLSVYYGEPYTSKYNGILTRDSVIVGDAEEKIYLSWYFLDFKIERQYLLEEGNVKVVLDKTTLEEMANTKIYERTSRYYSVSLDYIDFTYIGIIQIIIAVVIWFLLIILPIAIPKLIKKFRNTKNEKKQSKKLKEMRKIQDMKEMGIISQEDFEEKKKEILEK